MVRSSAIRLVLAAAASATVHAATAQTATLPQPAAAALAYDIYIGSPQDKATNDAFNFWVVDAGIGGLSLAAESPWPFVVSLIFAAYDVFGWNGGWYDIWKGSQNPNLDTVSINVGLFPSATYHYFDEGALLRELHSPDIYAIVGHAPLYVRSGDYFGWDWSRVRIVPDGRISAMSKVPAYGTMFKEQNRPEVWLSMSLWKCHIMTASAVNRYGGWGNIKTVPDGSIGHIPTAYDVY